MSWIEAENAFRLICHAWKTEKQLYRISIRYIARNTIAQQMILYPVHPCFRLVSETTLLMMQPLMATFTVLFPNLRND